MAQPAITPLGQPNVHIVSCSRWVPLCELLEIVWYVIIISPANTAVVTFEGKTVSSQYCEEITAGNSVNEFDFHSRHLDFAGRGQAFILTLTFPRWQSFHAHGYCAVYLRRGSEHQDSQPARQSFVFIHTVSLVSYSQCLLCKSL